MPLPAYLTIDFREDLRYSIYMTLLCMALMVVVSPNCELQAQVFDREELTLRGPVRELREDAILFSRSNGVSRRTAPYESLHAVYSPDGELQELEEFSEDGRRVYWWRSETESGGERVITVVQGDNRMITTIDGDGRIISRRRSSYGVSQTWDYEYDESGTVTDGNYTDSSSDENLRWHIIYNADGSIQEIRKTDSNKRRTLSIRTYEYTDATLTTEYAVQYDRKGNESATWEYRFDLHGNRVEETLRHGSPEFIARWRSEWQSRYRPDNRTTGAASGKIESTKTPRSDKLKNVLLSEQQETGSIPWQRKTYSYDSGDRVIESAEYNSIGIRVLRETFSYNDGGDIIAYATFSSSDSLLRKWSYRYEYDDRSNWVRREVFFTDNVQEEYDMPQEIRTRSITYYD